MYAKLAWRNIWRHKRRSLITVSAVVFAVVAAVFMQSINRGSHEVMLDRMIRFNTGYLRIQDERYEREPSLDNAFLPDPAWENPEHRFGGVPVQLIPRIETFMLAANDTSTRGTMVFAIDPEREQVFSGILDRVSEGRFFEDAERAAVLGAGLATRLQVGVGDTLALIGQGRFGMSASGLFEIVGLVDHPLRDMNNSAVYLPLPVAQEMLSAEGHVTALLLAPHRPRQTDRVAEALRRDLAGTELTVLAWPELLPELLELFEFDLATPRFLTVILYIVIGFGFFGAILTMTLERMREFGVLIAVGMKRGRLARVLLMETLLLGLLGIFSGLLAAYSLIFYFHRSPIVLTGDAAQAVMDMGWDPVLPVSFAADQFYTQAVYVFAVALLVFLFPLVKVFRLNVVETARN